MENKKESEMELLEQMMTLNKSEKQKAKKSFSTFITLKKGEEYHFRIDRIVGSQKKVWGKNKHLVNITEENKDSFGKKAIHTYMVVDITDLKTGFIHKWDIHPDALPELTKYYKTITGHTFSISYNIIIEKHLKKSLWNIFGMDEVYNK
jgi:hypothetical protein